MASVNVVKKLFIQWLTEWKDEAQAQSWKSQYTYAKALKSLKKYPLPVKCGQDAKILEFFGEKLCKMLDKKLATYKEENGFTVDISDTEEETPTPVKKRIKIKAPPVPSAPREYIPAFRSGPYALILTLYHDFQDPYSKGFMKKPELQKAAQDLSEKSMTVPEPNCHYTAWSSMSTLITKGLVTREGNPSRYTITPAGCDLAHKLEAGHDLARVRDSPVHNLSADLQRVPDLPNLGRLPQHQVTQKNKNTGGYAIADSLPCTSTKPDSFQYTYVDDQGREICNKDNAVVIIDDNFGVGFLIKCIESEITKFNVNHLKAPMKAPPGMAYVYIDNEQSAEICPGIQNKPKVKKRTIEDTTLQSKKQKIVKTKDISTFKEASSSGYPQTESLSGDVNFNSNLTQAKNHACDLRIQKSSTSSKSILTTNNMQTDCQINGISSGNSKFNTAEVKPEFTLKPGTFEIVLCVDNCEIGGASKRKKQLLEGLYKNNVALDVRRLQVGDFLWVAREKQVTANKEVVLDYVIERKRMDDLCGSIKDGRFKEQKFRLKQCGISNPVYLVEDYGPMENMSLPKATLQQAIVNTQIVDKFHVKHTCGIQDSVAYLTVMTRYLQSNYSGKTINAYTRENFETLKVTQKLNDKTQHLMSFYEFNENSIKNKILTTGEVFAKQLLQFSGLTAEKAKAIINVYPTVSHLLDAYSECETEKECHKLLSTLKCGKTQRNLGPALSSLIHRMYATPGSLT